MIEKLSDFDAQLGLMTRKYFALRATAGEEERKRTDLEAALVDGGNQLQRQNATVLRLQSALARLRRESSSLRDRATNAEAEARALRDEVASLNAALDSLAAVGEVTQATYQTGEAIQATSRTGEAMQTTSQTGEAIQATSPAVATPATATATSQGAGDSSGSFLGGGLTASAAFAALRNSFRAATVASAPSPAQLPAAGTVGAASSPLSPVSSLAASAGAASQVADDAAAASRGAATLAAATRAGASEAERIQAAIQKLELLRTRSAGSATSSLTHAPTAGLASGPSAAASIPATGPSAAASDLTDGPSAAASAPAAGPSSATSAPAAAAPRAETAAGDTPVHATGGLGGSLLAEQRFPSQIDSEEDETSDAPFPAPADAAARSLPSGSYDAAARSADTEPEGAAPVDDAPRDGAPVGLPREDSEPVGLAPEVEAAVPSPSAVSVPGGPVSVAPIQESDETKDAPATPADSQAPTVVRSLSFAPSDDPSSSGTALGGLGGNAGVAKSIGAFLSSRYSSMTTALTSAWAAAPSGSSNLEAWTAAAAAAPSRTHEYQVADYEDGVDGWEKGAGRGSERGSPSSSWSTPKDAPLELDSGGDPSEPVLLEGKAGVALNPPAAGGRQGKLDKLVRERARASRKGFARASSPKKVAKKGPQAGKKESKANQA